MQTGLIRRLRHPKILDFCSNHESSAFSTTSSPPLASKASTSSSTSTLASTGVIRHRPVSPGARHLLGSDGEREPEEHGTGTTNTGTTATNSSCDDDDGDDRRLTIDQTMTNTMVEQRA
jgi:hypothetical protein